MAAQPEALAPHPASLLPLPAPPTESGPKVSLYVGDLHPDVTEMDLVEAFGRMGPLSSVRLCRDRFSHQSLRYGYINFLSHSDASEALACLNHTKLKGNPMRVMWCERDPLKRNANIGNLFVKNLDPSVTSARLEGVFSKFGTILSCKVAEEHGKSKGFGFIQFDSEDSSIAALNALHNTMLEGKKLYVSKFLKRSERKVAHEEPKLFTNLYVKNLGENVSDDVLRDKFSEFGRVTSVMIMKDAKGKSRGFGFVNFESHEEAKKAVEALNGTFLGSEELFVGKAQKKDEREELLKREYKEKVNHDTEKIKASTLYVKNLNAWVDERKLEELFRAFGKVTSAKVLRYGDGSSKGVGFVSLSTPDEATIALNKLNGTIVQGKSLYVAIAQGKEERCRQLLSYYPQYPLQYSCYPSHADARTHPTYYAFPPFPTPNQPWLYHDSGRSVDAVYPFTFMGQSYQRDIPTDIPVRQPQQGTYVGRSIQYPTRFSNSNGPAKELNYGSRKNQKVSWNKRSGAAETFYKGFAPTTVPAAASSPGNCKGKIGELIQPIAKHLQPEHAKKITGMVLEMESSDARKLLNSPVSLAVQVERAVRVLKDANFRTLADGHVAQPAKSARCLSYH